MSFEEWYDQHFGSADPNVVKAGTIDLGDRPAVYNEDGTVSTEKSFSIGDEYGRETLLPQVVGGKMLSKKDAIQHYRDTGEHLGIYKDIPTANAYAKAIHERTPRLDTPETFPVGNLFQSVRQLPGWAAYRMYRGATRNDLPPPPPGFNQFSLDRAMQNSGEGPSAREQEAAMPPPYLRGKLSPMAQLATDPDWSFQRAKENFPKQIPELYNQLKQQILPPGFSAQRGLDSALAPAKWLFNEIRQGVLSDDDLAEIKRNPYSPRSIEAMTQAAISLSGGKGGGELGPRGAMPEHIWNSMKPLDVGPGKTYVAGQGGEIRVDKAGNHYQMEGTHQDQSTGQTHIIIKPVEAPGSGTPITPADTIELLNKLHSQQQQSPGEIIKEQTEGIQSDLRKIAEWEKGLASGDITQAQYDAAVDAITKGEMPPLPPSKTASLWDEWSKQHNNLKPDFGPPELPPPPEQLMPYDPRNPPIVPPTRFNWKPPPEHGGNYL